MVARFGSMAAQELFSRHALFAGGLQFQNFDRPLPSRNNQAVQRGNMTRLSGTRSDQFGNFGAIDNYAQRRFALPKVKRVRSGPRLHGTNLLAPSLGRLSPID